MRPKHLATPSADRPGWEEVAALNAAVEHLSQQVQILTDILDRVREELQWAINNREEFRCKPQQIMHITSMPKDPCAQDFGERVNRFAAKDLPPAETGALNAPDEGSHQGSLFD